MTKQYSKHKSHIPLDTVFALGTQREQTGDKQHEINMPNVNPALLYLTQTI